MLGKKILFAEGDVQIELIDDPNDPIWQTIYDKYCKSFLIEDERDPLESLRNSAAYNCDKYHDNTLILTKKGEIASVFMVAWIRATESCSFGVGTYLFTDPAYRGLGLATLLVKQGELLVLKLAEEAKTKLIGFFVEVNNPLKMSHETLDIDNKIMDPFQRIFFWKKRGYKKIDTDYEQPSLVPGGKAVPFLDLYFKPGLPEFETGLPTDLFLTVVLSYFNYLDDITNIGFYLEKIKKSLLDKSLVMLQS